MDDLITVIIDTVLREPEHNWRVALREEIDAYTRTAEMASQIKVGPKSSGQSIPIAKVRFEPVGRGVRPSDGKKFTVYQLGPESRTRPHNNGTPLTDDEIKATVDGWNKDAEKLVRNAFRRD